MPSISLSLTVELDGQPLSGFPIVRRSVVSRSIAFQVSQATAGNTTSFSQLPLTSLSTCTFFVLHVDQPVTVRMGDQADAADRPVVPLTRGGLLLFLDGGITETGTNPGPIRVNNNSGQTVNLQGVGAGS